MTGVSVGAIAPTEAPEPERNQYGHYVVLNPDGVREGYRRSTSVAHKLGDAQNLEHWGKTMVVSGLGRDRELWKLASSHPDPALARSTYKEIVEAAEELSGANAARRRGSHLHKLTFLADIGQLDTVEVEPEDMARVELYQAKLAEHGITILPQFAEVVLLLDGMKIAGTADRFGLLPDGRMVVLDVKTGGLKYGHLEWAAQLSMYANHDARWVHVKGGEWERQPAIPGVDTEWGIIIHLPATGEPECSLHWIDLEAGYGGLIYAAGLMEYRKLKVMTPLFPGGSVPDRKAVMLPAAPEWEPNEDEQAAPALTLVRSPAGGDAPEPSDENSVRPTLTPEPDLATQVHAWLVDRMATLGALWEQGTQGPLNMLMQRWPSTVPQPLPAILSPVQVEDLVTQLDIIEREYETPFTPPRPGTPPGKPTRPKAEPPKRRATPASKAVAKAAAKRTTTKKETK